MKVTPCNYIKLVPINSHWVTTFSLCEVPSFPTMPALDEAERTSR